jgi:formylglycine-generating enzyme required for sulfatase activity
MCNGADTGLGGPVAYTSQQSCIGGETGMVEMSGNVAEWEDSCNAYSGASDNCGVRGGAYDSMQSSLRCDSGGSLATMARNAQLDDVGFRCCL